MSATINESVAWQQYWWQVDGRATEDAVAMS